MCFTDSCNILKREAFARRSKMLTRRRVSLGEQGQPEETRRSVNLILLAAIFRAGFPGGVTGKEPTCQCRRRRFDPWARKIPCSRKWQPTQYSCLENPIDFPISFPPHRIEEPDRLQSMESQELDTTKLPVAF